MMKLLGTSIIGYARGGRGGKTLCGINPATRERLPPEYQSASEAELDVAVNLAEAAFRIYSRVSGKERGSFLRKIAEKLELAIHAQRCK